MYSAMHSTIDRDGSGRQSLQLSLDKTAVDLDITQPNREKGLPLSFKNVHSRDYPGVLVDPKMEVRRRGIVLGLGQDTDQMLFGGKHAKVVVFR